MSHDPDSGNDTSGGDAQVRGDAPSVADPSVGADPSAGAGPSAGADPDEELKARYREALAHKHGSSGAHRTVHGDKGESAHSQSAGPTQKMFRRKAGG